MISVRFVCGTQFEADNIVNVLLTKGLIASAQFKEVDSKFVWKNELVCTSECEVICYTRKCAFNDIVKVIERNHSYEVPQIICTPIELSNEKFKDWVYSLVKER